MQPIQNLGPVDDLQLDDWNSLLSINASSPLFLVQAFLKLLTENNACDQYNVFMLN